MRHILIRDELNIASPIKLINAILPIKTLHYLVKDKIEGRHGMHIRRLDLQGVIDHLAAYLLPKVLYIPKGTLDDNALVKKGLGIPIASREAPSTY